MRPLGISNGEIATPYCLGALTGENSLWVAHHRGVVSTTLKKIALGILESMMIVGEMFQISADVDISSPELERATLL